MMGDSAKFITANTEVEVRWFEEKPIQVKIPVKMDLKVKEAPPNTRGNRSDDGRFCEIHHGQYGGRGALVRGKAHTGKNSGQNGPQGEGGPAQHARQQI